MNLNKQRIAIAPAQVTEAHIALSARITRESGYDPESTWNRPHVLRDAQYIADSEALACEQLRADVEELRFLHQCESDSSVEAYARAERAEAELSTERARLDWLQKHALAQHSESISISKLGKHYNGFPGSFRAAIDATMKENA